MKFLALFSLLFSTHIYASDNQGMPYQDTEFGCITQEQADKYVTDFSIDVASFGGMELCNSKVDTKKLFNDLQILEQGQFDQDSQNKFVRGYVPINTYYDWMKHETRGIQRGQDVPYATAYNSGGYFTMQDGWSKLSTLGRVGTVVHEARHTGGYYHIVCQQGPYKDTSVQGCDTNYNYGGSHAVEMEYYARVSVQGKNFHPVYQKMARLMAIARSNIFFNTPVITPREAVLGLNQDRTQGRLFDNGQWYNREVPNIAGRLKRTSYGAVLFDGLQALAIELYKNSGFPDLVKDTYSYYKLLGENQGAIKEFEEFDSGPKRFVVKISQDNKITPYDFPNGKWGKDLSLPFQVAKTSTAIADNAQSGLYLVSTTGEVFNYQPQTAKVATTRTNWNGENKQVIVFKGQNLVLKTDGRIYLQKDGVASPWSETNELFTDLITTPVYDGFEVTKE